MKNCVFCKIISRELPSNILFEDDFVIALLDINPISDGHTLIIPKKHIRDFGDLDEEALLSVLKFIKKIGPILERDFGFDGTEIRTVSRAFQDVPHLHIHVFGRNKNNDIKIKYPEVGECSEKKLQEIMVRIRAE